MAQQGLEQPTGQDFFWGASGQLPQLLRVSAEATRARVRSAFMGVWCWMADAGGEPAHSGESMFHSRYSTQS
ncbi:MAG TPA: hypothetical protein DDZ88_07570 [Verrucomicrobiales bacterium]|nr:hypothetical protein [Verrucomicrobiales bacterium]